MSFEFGWVKKQTVDPVCVRAELIHAETSKACPDYIIIVW